MNKKVTDKEMQQYRERHRAELLMAANTIHSSGYDVGIALDNYCESECSTMLCEGFVRHIEVPANKIIHEYFGTLVRTGKQHADESIEWIVNVLVEFIWSGVRSRELVRQVKPSDLVAKYSEWSYCSVRLCCKKISLHYGIDYLYHRL